ncbi:carbonyl reductase (nadph) 1 [Trichuris trichiura]|uniref:carbonyl reductase (NADPH) n=1 Tax=Trichuris trichiura TaxID=36087 RepID=A0A077ZE80_TRITR|nr:carbonyl reductase (nadph) 1 [Trichuris trichiura]
MVTGGNKGIGYAIVRGLCERFDGIVYLTARNVELGKAAVNSVNQEVESPKCAALRFHQLDITDEESILRFKRHIEENGGLDILINNAGIAFKHDSTVPAGEQAEVTLKTNYWGTKAVCEQLFPLLRRNGRVVNVSSQSGLLRCIKDEALKNRLESPSLTKEELDSIMEDFTRAAKEGTRRENGYPENNYSMSKVGETALTMIQQRMLDKEGRSDVIVNACCPGYVDTDLTSHKGPLTIREGAETPLFLALEEADRLARGKFYYKKRETNWRTGEQVV